MSNNYFNPTPLYKEYMVLDLIDKNSHITQRTMSKELKVAVSMINSYLVKYEEKGLIKRKYISSKNVRYKITRKGIDRKKVLNIGFLSSSQKIYQIAKENIKLFLNQIVARDFKNILLYGAGEVAEILLQTINEDKSIPLNVVGVIDDDFDKINKQLANYMIYSVADIITLDHDGILISSYTNKELIFKKLIHLNYNKNNILQFFDL